MSQKEVSQVVDTFNIIGKAAKQSDRWWFLTLLIIGMVAAGWIIKESRDEIARVRKEGNEQNTALTNKVDKLHETIETLMTKTLMATQEALDKNSNAVEKNTQTLLRVETTLNARTVN